MPCHIAYSMLFIHNKYSSTLTHLRKGSNAAPSSRCCHYRGRHLLQQSLCCHWYSYSFSLSFSLSLCVFTSLFINIHTLASLCVSNFFCVVCVSMSICLLACAIGLSLSVSVSWSLPIRRHLRFLRSFRLLGFSQNYYSTTYRMYDYMTDDVPQYIRRYGAGTILALPYNNDTV